MNRFKNSLALILFSLSFGLGSTLHGSVIFDVNFDADTVGSAPSIASPVAGQPVTKPSGVTQSTGSILVANDYTNGTAALSGKSLLYTNSANSTPYFTVQGAAADFGANVDYRISMDLLFGSSSTFTSPSLTIRLNNNGSIGSSNFQSQVRFNYSGGKYVLQLIDGGGTGSVATTNFNLSNNIYQGVIQLELELLYSTNTLNAYINGDLIGGIAMNPSGTHGFNAVQFYRTNANSVFAVAIDNINASAIPEASTTALFLLACGGVFVRSWRKKVG